MAYRGYSKVILRRMELADPNEIGVRLGLLCVKHGYSVVEVAEVFSVSRMTVYNWITGKYKVSKHLLEKVQALVERLESKPIPEPVAENE